MPPGCRHLCPRRPEFLLPFGLSGGISCRYGQQRRGYGQTIEERGGACRGRSGRSLPASLNAMPKKQTATAVLLGVFAFAVVASRSLFVVGEATGGIRPGFHPTTEGEWAACAAHEADLAPVDEGATEKQAVASASSRSRRDTVKAPASASYDVPPGYVYWKTVRAKVTAYDPSRLSCGKYADGKTSIGKNAWSMDGVAAYPKAIPYGTYVVIPGVGARIVDDTGSAMRTSWRRYRRFHIDLRVTYPYQARRWGVKYMDVKLYRKAR